MGLAICESEQNKDEILRCDLSLFMLRNVYFAKFQYIMRWGNISIKILKNVKNGIPFY
jgi:hypothetical protein